MNGLSDETLDLLGAWSIIMLGIVGLVNVMSRTPVRTEFQLLLKAQARKQVQNHEPGSVGSSIGHVLDYMLITGNGEGAYAVKKTLLDPKAKKLLKSLDPKDGRRFQQIETHFHNKLHIENPQEYRRFDSKLLRLIGPSVRCFLHVQLMKADRAGSKFLDALVEALRPKY